MKSLINKMATARKIDLSQTGAHFRVKADGFMDLHVENIGRHCVSVAHYYSQNGDLIQDPEIVFWMCPIDGEWYATEWTTPPVYILGRMMGGYQRVLELDGKGERWTQGKPKAQAELAAFGNTWATNLRRQGFE